jgi:hypothetical protein
MVEVAFLLKPKAKGLTGEVEVVEPELNQLEHNKVVVELVQCG